MGNRPCTSAPVPGGVIFAMKRGSGRRSPPARRRPGAWPQFDPRPSRRVDGCGRRASLRSSAALEPSVAAGPARHRGCTSPTRFAPLDFLGWDKAGPIGHDWGGRPGDADMAVCASRSASPASVPIGTLACRPATAGVARWSRTSSRRRTSERAIPAGTRSSPVRRGATRIRPCGATSWRSCGRPDYDDHSTRPVELRLKLKRRSRTRPARSRRSRDTSTTRRSFEVSSPTRVLPPASHGDDDPLPSSVAVETAALIRGARVEIVDRCGHYPWLERPGVVRAAVEAAITEAEILSSESPAVIAESGTRYWTRASAAFASAVNSSGVDDVVSGLRVEVDDRLAFDEFDDPSPGRYVGSFADTR